MTTSNRTSRRTAPLRLNTGTLPAITANGSGGGQLLFVRHGATDCNLRQLRCGGDLDVDLAPAGREQARDVAHRMQRYGIRPGLIVAASLARTRETAAIIGTHLGRVPVIDEPLLNERRLGEWNLQPHAATETALRAGMTPPGGEPGPEFEDRIATALDRILPLIGQNLLVVSSSGVARVINELVHGGGRLDAGNCELIAFEVAGMPLRRTAHHEPLTAHG